MLPKSLSGIGGASSSQRRKMERGEREADAGRDASSEGGTVGSKIASDQR